MAKAYEIEQNPGHRLQVTLKAMFPFNNDVKHSFLSDIDNTLVAEGQLVELVYNSTINYMVRRFITTAKFLKNKVENQGLSDIVFFDRLRRFVDDQLKIPATKTELIVTLLSECVKTSGRKLPAQKLSRMKRAALKDGKDLRCRICGITMNLVDNDKPDSATIDHSWPSSLGGSNADSNLYLVCSRCNACKNSYIDASDFHYEEICLSLGKEEPHFSNQMARSYEIAVWAKNNYQCTRCDKPASYMGRLQYGRRNSSDSWHFLNLDPYCEKHSRA